MLVNKESWKIPNNLFTPYEEGITMQVFVDSDHVMLETKLQGVPELVSGSIWIVLWFMGYPRNKTETSSCGSEFIMAIKHTSNWISPRTEVKIESNGYPNWRMLLYYIYGNNRSILVNSSTIHSQLKKKSTLCYCLPPCTRRACPWWVDGEPCVSIQLRIWQACWLRIYLQGNKNWNCVMFSFNI